MRILTRACHASQAARSNPISFCRAAGASFRRQRPVFAHLSRLCPRRSSARTAGSALIPRSGRRGAARDPGRGFDWRDALFGALDNRPARMLSADNIHPRKPLLSADNNLFQPLVEPGASRLAFPRLPPALYVARTPISATISYFIRRPCRSPGVGPHALGPASDGRTEAVDRKVGLSVGCSSR